jgi:nitroreductase
VEHVANSRLPSDSAQTSDIGTDIGFEPLATLLRSRRTVHDFLETAVPQAVIEEALELACWVPNHRQTEPWRFHLLDRALGLELAALNADLVRQTKGEAAAAAKLRRWSQVPGWLVITCASSADELRQREDYAACCCAAHNLSLALWVQGVGLKWTTGAVTRHPRFYELVGVDSALEQAIGLFWFGYPAEIPRQSRRSARELTRRVGVAGSTP